MESLLGTLNEDELALVREAEPVALTALDEDALLDLHKRVRRARNKYTKQYRRQAAAGVAKHGGRGKSRPKNRRAAEKAEVFETVLSVVSKQVDVVARRTAAALKKERLAAARANRSTGPGTGAGSAPPATPAGRATGATKTTGGLKRDASSAAQGARRQAKRDAT